MNIKTIEDIAKAAYKKSKDADAQLAQIVNKEDWIVPTLLNGWVGTVLYRKTANNELEIYMHQVKNGTSGSHFFLLPGGYRPIRPHLLPITRAFVTMGSLNITTSGHTIISTGGTTDNHTMFIKIPLD